MSESESSVSSRRVHPLIDRLAAYSWRLIAIGVVAIAALWLLRQVRVVFFPIVIAIFLARVLSPVASWLRRHHFRPGLAALASMAGFFVVLAGLVAVAVPSFATELDSIGPTLTQALDDVEDWLVNDSPINISRESVERVRERAAEEVGNLASSSDGSTAARATVVAEVVTGSVLAIILTFFLLRDGQRFVEWACRRAGQGRQGRLRRALDQAWSTLAGYLRGATLLGVVEAIMIGLTLWLSGGGLLVPVMLLTFMGAYVPLVGAVLAGVVAVLVALVTGGTGSAVAVAVVALIVQQLDNDLLAPIIYGRTLNLHPVVILIGVVTGGALFGLAGTILAVPVLAVAINATQAYRSAPAATSLTRTDSAGV